MILNKKLENYLLILQSLPSWECGLKFWCDPQYLSVDCVAPFVGVWIEITIYWIWCNLYAVAPFVGVWIEISNASCLILLNSSLPSWECGLKFLEVVLKYRLLLSLPSWECGLKLLLAMHLSASVLCRSLRGSVD